MPISADSERRFWVLHLLMPMAAYALVFIPLSVGDWNAAIARAWAFVPPGGWIAHEAWWAEELVHHGGRNGIRAIAAVCVIVALLARRGSLQRSIAAYLFVAIATSALLAGALKHVTNVDCPWDLVGFGGTRPHVPLFGNRPDTLPQAACFPGAHAASGFALLGFYFAFRDRSRRLALLGLALGIVTGVTFSVAQEARGAHFLSHDLTGAFLSWCVCLLLYAWWRTPHSHGRPT